MIGLIARGLLAFLLLGVGAIACAVVELVPDRRGTLAVARVFWITNDLTEPRLLDVIRFDFDDSDDRVQLAPVHLFDFSSVPSGLFGFLTFLELPRPVTHQTFYCICPQHYIPLPGQEAVHIAGLQVDWPPDPGSCLIDALNADTLSGEFGFGARIEVLSSTG